MRRKDREVTDEQEILKILSESKVLHLGLSDGMQSYVVPMNYGYIYENNKLKLFLHGAINGYKMELIRQNEKMSFALETGVMLIEAKTACQYGTVYASVLGKGIARIVEDIEEKEYALSVIMKTQTGKDFVFDEKMVSDVGVITVDVTEFSAKSHSMPK